MKKFLTQSVIIISISLVVGLVYNQMLESPLPVFKKFDIKLFPETVKTGGTQGSPAHFQEADEMLLKQLLESEEAILIDSRTKEEFERKHIPSAINLPVSDFESVYNKISGNLDREKIIVVYCISKNCTDSEILATMLSQEKGFINIMVYRGGLEDWLSKGNKVKGTESN